MEKAEVISAAVSHALLASLARRRFASRSTDRRPRRLKLCILLDIDNTLTARGMHEPDPRCRDVVDWLQKRGHRVFLVSGRTRNDVVKVVKAVSAQPDAICENGGLIISRRRSVALGSKRECERDLAKLRRSLPRRDRRLIKKVARVPSETEIVLAPIRDKALDRIQKKAASLDLGIALDRSLRYIHVHSKNVNKGTALLKLMEMKCIDWNRTVAFGDSQIDVPVLRLVRYGYVVGNADPSLKEGHDNISVLTRGYFEGVMEGLMQHDRDLARMIKTKGLLNLSS